MDIDAEQLVRKLRVDLRGSLEQLRTDLESGLERDAYMKKCGQCREIRRQLTELNKLALARRIDDE